MFIKVLAMDLVFAQRMEHVYVIVFIWFVYVLLMRKKRRKEKENIYICLGKCMSI